MFETTTRIAPCAPYPAAATLLADVRDFRFTGVPGRGMAVGALRLGALTLGRVRSGGHEIALCEPDRLTFIAPLTGAIETEAGGRRMVAGAGASIFVREGFRRTRVRAGTAADYLAAVVLAPAPARPRPARSPGFAAAVAPASRAFAAHLRWLLDELARPETALARPGALAATGALFADFFAALEEADGDAPAGAAAGLSRVRRAEAFMRAHADEPLEMAAVAAAVGVGLRALKLGFRAHVGRSPRAALADIRLDRARARLAAPEPAATVSGVALLSGFAHLGRFAAAYRARFGEAPSATLARARAGRTD